MTLPDISAGLREGDLCAAGHIRKHTKVRGESFREGVKDRDAPRQKKRARTARMRHTKKERDTKEMCTVA